MSDAGRVVGTIIWAGVGGIIGFALGGGNPLSAIQGAGAGASLFLSLTKPKSPTYDSGGLSTQASNEALVPIIYGMMRSGGNCVYQRLSDNKKTLYMLVSYGEGVIDHFEGVTVNNVPIDKLPDCSYTAYLGAADQTLDSRCTEGVATVGGLRNTAYLALTLKKSDQFNPENRPNISAIIYGRLVRTWSNGAWVTQYSTNPVWCLLDLLTNSRYGAGYTEDRLDLESFKAAAQYCDEQVNGQPRFTLNICIDWQEPIVDLVDRLRLTFRGYFIYHAGKLYLKAEQPEPVLQHFTDDHIVPGSLEITVPSADQMPDLVKVNYSDPGEDWATMTAQAGPGRLTGDPLPPVIKEYDIRGIDNFNQASRLAYFYWAFYNYCYLSGRFKTTIRALNRTPGDVIAITCKLMEWDQKPVRITEMREAEDHTIEISWREYNASIYTDQPGSAHPTPIYTKLPNAAEPPPDVQNLSIVENGWLNRDGVFHSQLEILFTPPDHLFYSHALIQTSVNGGAWVDRGICYESTVLIPGVRVGDTYQVRVQSVAKSGLRSSGKVAAIQVVGKDAPPTDVSGLSARQDKLDVALVKLTWSGIPDIDCSRYEVRVGLSWDAGNIVATTQETSCTYRVSASGTYTFWAKSIDNSGNYSANPAGYTIQQLNVEPGSPTGLTAVQSLQDRSIVRLTWTAPEGTPVDYFEIRLGAVWNEAELLGYTKDVRFEHHVQASGLYTYLVRAHNLAGFHSIDEVAAVLPVKVEPPDVAELLAVQNGEQVYLQWPAVSDPDIVGYEIREGNGFDSGSLIATGVTDIKCLVPVSTETTRRYHIKAINRAGHRSRLEASAGVTITNLPPKNVIHGLNELDPVLAQNGTHTNTEFRSSSYRCSAVTFRCNDALMAGRTAADFGSQTVLALASGQIYGEYLSAVHNLGAVTTANLAAEWRTSCFLASATAVKLQCRISIDNLTWSEWQDFVPAVRTQQYIQFKAVLSTADPAQSPEIVTWYSRVDVPDVIDRGQNVDVEVDGNQVSFSRRFYAAPTVTATARVTEGPRFAGITNVTLTGFTVKVYDVAGNAVEGLIDWIAKGY